MHTKDNLINLDSDSIMSEHSDFLEYNAQFDYVRDAPLAADSPTKALNISDMVISRGDRMTRKTQTEI